MSRTRTLIAACLVALPIPVAFAACGSDENKDRDPQEVLSATFNNDTRITSGVLDISLEASAEGDQGGNFEVSLSGPFQGDPENENALPQLDMTASLSGEGGGQSLDFEGGLVVTDDNAYVEYGGQAYEVGTENFAQLKEQAESQTGQAGNGDFASSFREGCERAVEAQGGDPAACDFDISAWFTDLSNEGTEDVGGADTVHIAGALDVQTMLGDLVELGTSVPNADVQGLSPEQIQSQLDTVAQAVEEADFNVYSATEDDTLRRLDFTITVDPSQIPGGEQAGVDSIDLTFAVEISDVGSEQTIEAPADARPIEDLQGELGSLIPGLGAGGLTPGGGGIPGGSGGGGGSDPVTDCINEAKTPEEIQACLEG